LPYLLFCCYCIIHVGYFFVVLIVWILVCHIHLLFVYC
jgi:hypothetical protein